VVGRLTVRIVVHGARGVVSLTVAEAR